VLSTVFAIVVRELKFNEPLYISIPLGILSIVAWILIARDVRRPPDSQGESLQASTKDQPERESASAGLRAEVDSRI
jgi:hypothetical protein